MNDAGFSRFRVAAETPLNLIIEASPVRSAPPWSPTPCARDPRRAAAGTVHAPCSDTPAPRHECCSPECWRSHSRAARSPWSSRSISEVATAGAVPGSVIVWPLARDRRRRTRRLICHSIHRPAGCAALRARPDALAAGEPALRPRSPTRSRRSSPIRGVAPHRTTASVWIDGWGEVLAHEPDLALAPASNEKIFTAMGALAVLGADARLTTEIRLSTNGDLVVVGGGDATLTSSGPHSVAVLADQVRANGVGNVPGALVVDETRHDGARRAECVAGLADPHLHRPALGVRGRPQSLARRPRVPRRSRARECGPLRRRAGGTWHRGGRSDCLRGHTRRRNRRRLPRLRRRWARWCSDLLQRSDNQIADLLLKEIGHAAPGTGSMADGFGATTKALGAALHPADRHRRRRLGTEPGERPVGAGVAYDPPGRAVVSRGGRRSSTGFRSRAVRARWRRGFAERQQRPTCAPKTGTIIGGTALSGYGTTAGGRAFVFSVVVNGPGAEASAGAIDALVVALAREAG